MDFNGFGYYLFESGYYFGQFRKGRFEGQGTYQSFLGYKYVGSFIADLFSGDGRMSYIDGGEFYGGFKQDRRHGKGEIIRANGNSQIGFWKDGSLQRSKNFSSRVDLELYKKTQKDSVKKIQILLRENGYLKGQADGILGGQTRKALWAFTKDADLQGRQVQLLESLDLEARTVLLDLSQRVLNKNDLCRRSTDLWTACFTVSR